MQEKEHLLSTDLIVNQAASIQLKEIALWSKLISLLGFLLSGFIALGGVPACIKIIRLSNKTVFYSSGIIKVASAGIIYLLGAVIVFLLSFYLYKFSKNTLGAVVNNDQEQLAVSFRQLKIHFRYAGIITIILLIFTLLAVVGILMAVYKK